uniref:Uncharacterized protein n=3 Tax=Oryza TaxID=4527 RepID=A0A0D3H8E1_9ORYZ
MAFAARLTGNSDCLLN